MMNHACEPNVVSSFCGATIIVRAVGDISAGNEVFNCYGPHLRRHGRKERREMLLSQYNFECQCSGCNDPKFDDLTARFSALKCQFCDEGALRYV